LKLGMKVGLGPGNTVLDGDTAPPQKGATVGWIKSLLNLGPDDIV